jgi:hypothetical protein
MEYIPWVNPGRHLNHCVTKAYRLNHHLSPPCKECLAAGVRKRLPDNPSTCNPSGRTHYSLEWVPRRQRLHLRPSSHVTLAREMSPAPPPFLQTLYHKKHRQLLTNERSTLPLHLTDPDEKTPTHTLSDDAHARNTNTNGVNLRLNP